MSALPILDLGPADGPAPDPLDSFVRYTPRPGHPDWRRLDAEAQALADELLPTLERPLRGPRAWWRQLRAWGTAARNYIINRRLHRQGREDLRPLYFIWTTLRSCNFTCTYCDDHRGRKYPDLPTDGTLDTDGGLRLLEVMRTRTPAVYFAGGEPTLRNDLPQLTRRARELAYHPVVINTNAAIIDRRLRRPDWAGWLADMDLVIVSVDGLGLDWLGRTWVTTQPEDVLRNLLLLERLAWPLGFKLLVNTVIQPGRVQEASDAFDLCQDLGIWFTPVPVNQGPRIAGGNGDLASTAVTCTNDGAANFDCAAIGDGPVRTQSAYFGDVDDDGDQDLVVAADGRTTGAGLGICTNDGSGAFSCAPAADMEQTHLYWRAYFVNLLSPVDSGPAVETGSVCTTPYLSDADIPSGFYASGAPTFLEDVEDGSVDGGISVSGPSYRVVLSSEVNGDSVDGDDGDIDGSGSAGQAIFTRANVGPQVVTFPGNPTAVGVVLTDGLGSWDVDAYDASGALITTAGTVSLVAPHDGDTAEDTFVGFHHGDGIAELVLRKTDAGNSGLETDHFQYGDAGTMVAGPCAPAVVDTDGDGTPDDEDDFPNDPTETVDSDGDGVGDNADTCPGGDDGVDTDSDGVCDFLDACPVDLYNDSDGDGSCDSEDPCPLDLDDDADNDGICGDVDFCPLDFDNDIDLDGICGDVDACPLDAANDADGDGVCGNEDTCEGGDDSQDADFDGTADFCDICPLDDANDADNDGVCGDVDVCPFDALDDIDGDGLCAVDDNCDGVANGAQSDVDGDGIGDVCDPDNDNDGVDNEADNCPLDYNPDQADLDIDFIGDVCDLDSDGDTIVDIDDTCLNTEPGEVVLDNGCSLVQVCPCDGAWKNHGAYERCVSQTLRDMRKRDLITGRDARQLRHESRDNQCGRTGRGRRHHHGDDGHDFEDESGHECRDHGHRHRRGRGHDRH